MYGILYDFNREYPVAPERSGSPADYANYVSFLKNLKGALGAAGHNYGLSITIPSSYWYMQHFDIVQISSIIDWFNIMSYDLHGKSQIGSNITGIVLKEWVGTWDSTDPYIGPVVNAHTNLTEIDQTLNLLWRNNVCTPKLPNNRSKTLIATHRLTRPKSVLELGFTVAALHSQTLRALHQAVLSVLVVAPDHVQHRQARCPFQKFRMLFLQVRLLLLIQ